MAYPNLYSVTYSYTGFQQSQQGISAFPGTQLDADLAGLTSSIDGLAAFLERTIRSDGNLNNGIVNYDSLSPALQSAGLAPASPWKTGTAYAASANVVFGVGFYRCLVPHTSGVFATDLAAGDWLLVATLPTADTTATTGIIYAFNNGAVPGTADASPGIMAAVAVADGLGGPTVKLTNGIFKLNSTIALNKWESRSAPPLTGLLTVPGLKIDGAGKGVTFLDTNVANGYAIAANPAWRATHLSQYLTTVSAAGGTLATNNYFVQITKTDPLGNEIFVTLAKSYAVTGPTGSISIPLQATSPGYTYNIYADTAATPGHRAVVAGSDAIGLAGGQTVTITAIGSAHVIPTDKQAVWQEVSVSNLTIISTSGAANASGVLYFKTGYAKLTNVEIFGIKGSGFDNPNYTGDIDGSFKTVVDGCKFDTIPNWGVNSLGAALENSNFKIINSDFNLCGTLPANLNVLVAAASITNSATPLVTTTTAHGFLVNDQILQSSVTGMVLPDAWYRVATVPSGSTFTLVKLDGSALDTTALGAFVSGNVSLAWRPPFFNIATGAVVGSGGMAWCGLIGNVDNVNFTQCNVVDIYVSENGSSDNFHMKNVDHENCAGKPLYIGGLTGGSWEGGEILSTAGLGDTISGCQLGTGFAAGGVKNFDIAKAGAIKWRNNVAGTIGFEQFQNTTIGKTFADTVRVGKVDWQTEPTTRFKGFVFDPIPGQVRLSVTAPNTFQLKPIGFGGTLPLHLKPNGEWIPFHVPSAGITVVVAGGLTPNTFYNIFAYNNAVASLPASLSITPTLAGIVLDEGYNVSSADASQLLVGQWPTDGAGNFQSGGNGTSFYPPSGVVTVGAGALNGVPYYVNSTNIGSTAAGTNGQLLLGVTGAAPNFATMSGDATISNAGALTLASTIAAAGPIGSATAAPVVTYDAKGRLTAVTTVTITPAIGSVTGLGANVGAALAIAVGTAGSPVINGGALGAPASGTATNLTGTAAGLTAGNVTTNANLTGDVTSVGNATTLPSATVTGKLLTGYVSGAGTVGATDSILAAFQKINGNDALKLPLAGGTMSGAIAMGGNNIIGGTAAGATLTLQSTSSGAAAGDAVNVALGNNGAKIIGRWTQTGLGVNTVGNPVVDLQIGGVGGTNAGFEVIAGATVNFQFFNRNTSGYAPAIIAGSTLNFQAGVPATVLTLTGGTAAITGVLQTKQGTVAVANGLNSNTATPTASWVRLTGPTAAFSIGGFTGGVDGQELVVYNTTAQTMTIVNEDASSTAGNRLKTLTGANVVLRATATSSATFRYDATDSRWILTATN